LEFVLLLLLLVGAGALILPDILRERVIDSPLDTVSDWRRGMAALAVSTYNFKPSGGHYYMSVGRSDPEPYVRRNYFSEDDDHEVERDDTFVPYPSNKVRAEMETRRNRIIALLLIVTLATGICSLVPALRWIIPVHVAMLLLLALYVSLVILIPHYDRHH
jgi:VIT1/CCC1 family predicted Fe2+/Mn2+ transporter